MRNTVAMLGLAALAAGCSSTTAGTPTASSTPTTDPSAKTVPYGGAPKVENPLPDNALSGDPCQALTPQQITEQLGSAITGKPDSQPISSCSWTNPDTTASIGVSYYPASNDGLSNAYVNVKPQMKRWDVLPPIQGFPAVAYATQAGSTPNTCNVLVGVTDRLSFLVDVAPRTEKMGKVDSCAGAADVANDVITTLKQNAGG
ncbi:DUF3558 domain-containing protein [Amycolatopsis jiangsuensis]|uniref:DUF3558 domain-containing protein n=1 Tax=Amycolatopsis jiangsuensis TaxID=1181879 RepID=A0A840J8W9_9PSEU|nr:DUF3558 domain-containing protein [Amycolatopsis jiangsuensis]MBB4689838.1 hypothetical protein [Amycolatopsis jiangsuensis]